MTVLALTRLDIANYVGALFYVYILLIFIYILSNWVFALGVRLPHSRWLDAILGFLRDVSEPYLRLFRKLIPPIGGLDLTPMIAIFLLVIVSQIITNAIAGT
jgi:YggT family protein